MFNLTVQANIPVSYQWQFNGTNLPGALAPALGLTNVQYPDGGDYSVILSNAFEKKTNIATLIVSSVAAWGRNITGESTVPSLTNIIRVAGGQVHSVALRNDGTVVVWGLNSSDPRRKVPEDLTNAVAISAGEQNLALRSDGTVSSWGHLPGSISFP